MNSEEQESELRVGFVGLDSSHCIEYASMLNDAAHTHHVHGARVVCAYAGGSPDWELSYGRVEGYRRELEQRFGIRIESEIESVAESVDALMILSVDGRVHFSEFEKVSLYGKPVYIDKPLAIDCASAESIRELSERTGCRCFSSSVWRYTCSIKEALPHAPFQHAYVNGKWPLQPGRHGWFWYGIHLVEMLYAAMGEGCERVHAYREGDHVEVIGGIWKDGRTGAIITNRKEDRMFSGVYLGKENPFLIQSLDTKYDRYKSFLEDALTFFRGGKAPVSLRETVETIRFLNAADRSVSEGREISLQSL